MSRSIVESVYIYAKNSSDKMCLADDDRSITYSQYKDYISKIGTWLTDFGVKHGDCVVVEATQSIEYCAIELGIQLIGGVFVPVENKCAENRIVEIAKLCDAKMIIVIDKKSMMNCTHEANINSIIICSYEDIRNAEKESCPLDTNKMPSGDEVSEILFTTGTTGKQKGIVLTHANDIALAQNVSKGVQMEDDNIEMIPSPLNHSHGLRRYYANMYMGCSVVITAGVMNPLKFFDNIKTYKVTAIDMVPTALSVLLKLSKGELAKYADQLRYIQLGAAPLMQADKEKLMSLLPKTRLYNFYGSTESGCICIKEFSTGEDKKNCIGKPTCNARIDIVDDDRNIIESSINNTGTLASSGAMNMTGYYKDQEETASTLVSGVIYSNDVGYYDEDGDIILLGRKGDVINIGGNKVSPEEIENAAKKCTGVVDAGCIPLSDETYGQVPKLFIQMDTGMMADMAIIRSELSGQLEPYKVPKAIVQLDKIPRSYNGKLLRKELQ